MIFTIRLMDHACHVIQVKDSDTKKVALAAFDTLVWQAFASVIVPGTTNHFGRRDIELLSMTP